MLGFVDPMVAGVIRRTQVYVGSFTPPSPDVVESELQELVDWLNDEDTRLLDAVELAALAHYKLVIIFIIKFINFFNLRSIFIHLLMEMDVHRGY